MTQIKINENSLGQQYIFTVKEPGQNTPVDISNFNSGTMTFINNDNTIISSPNISFGDKAKGEVIYTTNPVDLPTLENGDIRIRAQIKISGPLPETDLTEIIEVVIIKDYSI